MLMRNHFISGIVDDVSVYGQHHWVNPLKERQGPPTTPFLHLISSYPLQVTIPGRTIVISQRILFNGRVKSFMVVVWNNVFAVVYVRLLKPRGWHRGADFIKFSTYFDTLVVLVEVSNAWPFCFLRVFMCVYWGVALKNSLVILLIYFNEWILFAGLLIWFYI